MASPLLQDLPKHPAESHPLLPNPIPPRRRGHSAAPFSPCVSQSHSNSAATQTNAPIPSRHSGTEPPAHSFPSQDPSPSPQKDPAKASGHFLAPRNEP